MAKEDKSAVEVSNATEGLPKKKFYQKWWFWVILLIVLGFVVYYSGLI